MSYEVDASLGAPPPPLVEPPPPYVESVVADARAQP